jgi:hypothetical protein
LLHPGAGTGAFNEIPSLLLGQMRKFFASFFQERRFFFSEKKKQKTF